MYSGQTTIKRVVARCPARTEPLLARVRLSHLLQSADLAPPGLPPQAVLVVRRVAARHNVSLAAFRLRPEWEREAREEVARNWRRAVRPARGRVPTDADAVWFEDVSEWLAALGLAVAHREVERHWCWHAALGTGVPTSTSTTLLRAWSQSPRFVPAAIVRLARWGETARVLGLLSPAEAHTLLSAIGAEFDLTHAAHARAAFNTPRASSHLHAPATSNNNSASLSSTDDTGTRGDDHRATNDPRSQHARPTITPPWKRWLASTDAACERLHAPAQRLLAFAAAVFHSPSHARARDFAAEVTAYVERVHHTRPEREAPTPTSRRSPHTRSREDATRTSDEHTHDLDAAHAATNDATNATRFARDASTNARDARDDRRPGEADAPPTSSARTPLDESPAAELPDSGPLNNQHDEEDAEELAARAAWHDLEGRETALGGVLFLLNFFVHLRLPECFDEDFQLSEHVTGWGLAELVGRALLAELGDDAARDEDPLWGVLARLDGRREGEPPAAGLRVGDDYRAPARWLRHFVACDAASSSFNVTVGRLELRHAGGFPVAVETLAGDAPSRVAARLVEDYRAQGVALEGLDEAVARLDDRRVDETIVGEASLDDQRLDETRVDDVRLDEESAGRFASFGHASLSPELSRWLGWTLPFMKYVLARALADEGALAGEELARTLLVKRGRVYATATHVDLVMGMREVSLAVRRAGFDASPGWMRDLVRVVAFHYE